MPAILLYGDTIRYPAIRHEIPLAIPDPLLYVATNGRAHVLTTSLEAELETAVRAVEPWGVRAARVPSDLPVAVADRLRAAGLRLDVDAGAVEGRRRVKSAAELAGIRRAQRAAEAGMAAAEARIRGAGGADGHDPGSGPLPADRPIVVDLWPRDEQSGCWADMTRTFVAGEITGAVAAVRDVVRWWRAT